MLIPENMLLRAYGQPNASSFPPPHPPQEEQVVSWGVHFPAEARTTSSVVILALRGTWVKTRA